MKIKFLLFALLISAFGANAQYSIVDGDGNDINDGDLIIRNSTEEDDALKFYVTNDSGAALRSTLEYVSTDVGGNFQVCYGGQCYDPVETGSSYPPVSTPQIIEPGATTGQGNKMFYNEVDNPQLSNHVFRFYLLDESGADIGGDLTFTYQYDPTMGLEDIASQLGITLDATVVTNTIALTSRENASMQIFDINGRLMQTNDVSVGAQHIDVSGLSSQLYIVSFEVANGNKQSIKVLKK
jgi:hypothetical protein